MKAALINAINQEVYRRFPDLQGARPRVHAQESQPATFVLVYRAKATLPGGKNMTRLVRVTASETGQILKVSTSR